MATKKRAAQGSGSIRKRPDGTWEARYTLEKDPKTGLPMAPVRKSVYGATQKEVRQKLTQILADIDDDNYFEPSKMTLAEFLDKVWFPDYMGDKKYLTVKSYRSQVDNHIKPVLGHIRLSQLHPHIIQQFYNQLQIDGCKVPKKDDAGELVRENGNIVYEYVPMSAKSIRNIHGILSKALSIAVKLQYIRSNPAELVTLPRVQRKELSPLMDTQVKDFLAAVEKDRFSLIFKTILFTGLRIGEACGLTWDCINFSAGTIKVYRQLQKRPAKDGGLVFATPKNSKTRIIKPAPFVMQYLVEQQKEQLAQKLAMGEDWIGWSTQKERKTALVFTMENGSGINPATLWRHFKTIVAEIGVPECRVHDLRHTFAVLSLQNGDDVKTVQSNLGHATASFTLDVYGHVSDKMREESAARMQAYFNSLTG